MPDKESDFIQEQIKERPISRKKLLRRTLITAGMAAVFGLVACLIFALLEPVISKRLYPEEKAETVRFPEETKEVSPEDMPVDEAALENLKEETQGSETAAETEETEDAIVYYQDVYTSLQKLAAEVECSLVEVTAVSSGENWMNNTLQREGISSGVLVADNGRDLLILAPTGTLEKADKIMVTFINGKSSEAEIKAMDKNTSLLILAVPKSELGDGMMESIQMATLGSSTGKSLLAKPVIAIGAPNGVNGSVCYGMVTGQGVPADLLDSNYKLILTDIYGSLDASGILVDMEGQLVGILYNGYKNKSMQNELVALGISELKKTIENLSNGRAPAYLGIKGADISPVIRSEYELPAGAYITSIEMDSPAMRAGIQSGDIITAIEGTEVAGYSELVNVLSNYYVGKTLSIDLVRQGQGEYREMTVDVTLIEQP